MKTKPTSVLGFLGLFCLVSLGLTVFSCGDSEETLLLQPPGGGGTGSGVISGTLTFDGAAGGRAARVFALRAYNAACVSAYSTIHVTGTMTNWDTGLWATTPGMRSLGGCVWYDEVALPSGPLAWKFVTNRAFDAPPDYVGTGGVGGLSGETVPGAGGSPNLQAESPGDATYSVFLNESTAPATYAITLPEAAPLAAVELATGNFEIPGLRSGTYELVVVADGFLDFHISNVVLDPDASVDLGTRDVSSASGEVRGSVRFSDSPDPLPTATVDALRPNGTIAATEETAGGGVFVFNGLTDGTYDFEIRAAGYLAGRIEDVVFANGEFVQLDPITLQVGCESAHEIVEVLGEFNNWTPVGVMSQVTDCVWEDTLTVVLTGTPPQRFYMKFRTGGSWDATPDFAHCGTEADTLDLVGELCMGDGSAPALPIFFPATGSYAFRVDESALTYTITLLSTVEVGRVVGQVDFEGNPEPRPTATVELLVPGTQEVVRSGRSDAVGAFSVEGVPVGTYDASVSAFGFVDVTIANVVVTAGETTTLELITLAQSDVCEPVSEIVQVVGDFNGWDTNTLPMTRLGTCLFADTLQIATSAGGQTHLMKFRTGNNWGELPDYGSCTSEADTLFDGGSVCLPAGSEPAMRVWFGATGDYEFRLNEENRTFTVRLLGSLDLGTITGRVEFSDAPVPRPAAIVQLKNEAGAVVSTTSSSTDDGSFTLEDVFGGTYSLEASLDGYHTATVTGVVVVEGDTTNAGTLTLVPRVFGTITGQVAWDDSPSTPPPTTARVFRANTNRVEGETTIDASGAYSVSGLVTGAYDVELSAPSYVTALVEDVQVVEGESVDVPLVTLAALGNCVPSSTVEIVGNWNGYPGEGLGPHMTNLGGCAWGDTLSIAASTLPDQKITFQFRLDEIADTDTQRGSCQPDQLLELAPGGEVTAPFCGWRGFRYYFNVTLPGDGDYIFRFDEAAETFSIRKVN